MCHGNPSTEYKDLFKVYLYFPYFSQTWELNATVDSPSKKRVELEARVWSVLESKDGKVFEHIK